MTLQKESTNQRDSRVKKWIAWAVLSISIPRLGFGLVIASLIAFNGRPERWVAWAIFAGIFAAAVLSGVYLNTRSQWYLPRGRVAPVMLEHVVASPLDAVLVLLGANLLIGNSSNVLEVFPGAFCVQVIALGAICVAVSRVIRHPSQWALTAILPLGAVAWSYLRVVDFVPTAWVWEQLLSAVLLMAILAVLSLTATVIYNKIQR